MTINVEFTVNEVLIHSHIQVFENVIARIKWTATLSRNGVAVTSMGVTRVPCTNLTSVNFTPVEEISNWTPWIVNNMSDNFLESLKTNHDAILTELEEISQLVPWSPA